MTEPHSDDAVTELDEPLEEVWRALVSADPTGERVAQIVRDTFDQLYDGQRTGRYDPAQLSKTEKTHCGSLIEINLRRHLADVFDDGDKLDFRVAGHEIDCKFSFTLGAWMLPPECFGELLLVCHADDNAGTWSLGLVRATALNRRSSVNRDAKTGLNATGRSAVRWLAHKQELPINVLLRLEPEDRVAVFSGKSGQMRVNELFRRAQLIPIGRNAVATVAQQDDYMKRVRYNGGARSTLQREGFLIPGGDYEVHRQIALDLGAPDINPGEFVSFRVVPAVEGEPQTVSLDGRRWRIAGPTEPSTIPAPKLPSTIRELGPTD
jgi:hypothetical protein